MNTLRAYFSDHHYVGEEYHAKPDSFRMEIIDKISWSEESGNNNLKM